MYGTVANIRVKVGHEDGIKQTMQEWKTERKPKVAGAMSANYSSWSAVRRTGVLGPFSRIRRHAVSMPRIRSKTSGSGG